MATKRLGRLRTSIHLAFWNGDPGLSESLGRACSLVPAGLPELSSLSALPPALLVFPVCLPVSGSCVTSVSMWLLWSYSAAAWFPH